MRGALWAGFSGWVPAVEWGLPDGAHNRDPRCGVAVVGVQPGLYLGFIPGRQRADLLSVLPGAPRTARPPRPCPVMDPRRIGHVVGNHQAPDASRLPATGEGPSDITLAHV